MNIRCNTAFAEGIHHHGVCMKDGPGVVDIDPVLLPDGSVQGEVGDHLIKGGQHIAIMFFQHFKKLIRHHVDATQDVIAQVLLCRFFHDAGDAHVLIKIDITIVPGAVADQVHRGNGRAHVVKHREDVAIDIFCRKNVGITQKNILSGDKFLFCREDSSSDALTLLLHIFHVEAGLDPGANGVSDG